jgi:hypothetical protein
LPMVPVPASSVWPGAVTESAGGVTRARATGPPRPLRRDHRPPPAQEPPKEVTTERSNRPAFGRRHLSRSRPSLTLPPCDWGCGCGCGSSSLGVLSGHRVAHSITSCCREAPRRDNAGHWRSCRRRVWYPAGRDGLTA